MSPRRPTMSCAAANGPCWRLSAMPRRCSRGPWRGLAIRLHSARSARMAARTCDTIGSRTSPTRLTRSSSGAWRGSTGVSPPASARRFAMAGHELGRQLTHRRLLLVVTDGEPWDIDVGDRRYLIEDARKAVMSLRHGGIDVFCVGLDSCGDSYLTRIFGRPNVVQIDRLERMPERLPMLYLRLTA